MRPFLGPRGVAVFVIEHSVPASEHEPHVGCSPSHRSLRRRQFAQASPGLCRGTLFSFQDSLRVGEEDDVEFGYIIVVFRALINIVTRDSNHEIYRLPITYPDLIIVKTTRSVLYNREELARLGVWLWKKHSDIS